MKTFSSQQKVNLFWFRRDLRIHDNHGFFNALSSPLPVLPVFIFDTRILGQLPPDDARVTFIYDQVEKMHAAFRAAGSSLLVLQGDPEALFRHLPGTYDIDTVFANEDYEPYALRRDESIARSLQNRGVHFRLSTDHLIFRPGEVVKDDGKPYTVFTPFMKRWKWNFHAGRLQPFPSETLMHRLHRFEHDFPAMSALGFVPSAIRVPGFNLSDAMLAGYPDNRNHPAVDGTSGLSPHLRFGTVSIRFCVECALQRSETFLNELIWREFFAHILYHFPEVEFRNFKRGFDLFPWENDPGKIDHWMTGTTGYPMVDAGMRQLVATGLMHNRVRMITASFLVKDLLVDWWIGEAFFARHLLDYELASNNGNWQWAAGTGCDAAPFFRIFNPVEQQRRYDPDGAYIRRWVPEYGSPGYPKPIVDHAAARKRALELYQTIRS